MQKTLKIYGDFFIKSDSKLSVWRGFMELALGVLALFGARYESWFWSWLLPFLLVMLVVSGVGDWRNKAKKKERKAIWCGSIVAIAAALTLAIWPPAQLPRYAIAAWFGASGSGLLHEALLGKNNPLALSLLLLASALAELAVAVVLALLNRNYNGLSQVLLLALVAQGLLTLTVSPFFKIVQKALSGGRRG